MGLTVHGWGIICILLLSIALSLRIVRRMRPGNKPGVVRVGYIALIIFILATLSYSLSGMVAGNIYNAIVLPKYNAVVTGSFAYTDKDSRNRSRTMYHSIVSFTDRDGHNIETKTDVSSSGARQVGTHITVVYKKGMSRAEELSGSKLLLMGGGLVILAVMVYFLAAGFAFAIGAQMRVFWKIGTGAVIYCMIPAGMLFLLSGISYALVLHFRGEMRHPMPLWAVILCSFFATVLLLGFLGYINMLRGQKGSRGAYLRVSRQYSSGWVRKK